MSLRSIPSMSSLRSFPRFASLPSFRAVVRSRTVLVLGVVVTVGLPLLTMPHLPALSPWPVVVGMVPWVVGQVSPLPAALARPHPARPERAAVAGLAPARVRRVRAARPAHARPSRRGRLARPSAREGGPPPRRRADVRGHGPTASGRSGWLPSSPSRPPTLPAQDADRSRRRSAWRSSSSPLVVHRHPARSCCRRGPLPRPRALVLGLVLSVGLPADASPDCSSARWQRPDTRSRRWRCSAPSAPARSPRPCPDRTVRVPATAPSWSRSWRSDCPGSRPRRRSPSRPRSRGCRPWLLGGLSLIVHRRQTRAAPVTA